MQRNIKMEEAIVSSFKRDWDRINEAMPPKSTGCQPCSWESDGFNIIGYAFYVKDEAVLFAPINYAYILSMRMDGATLVGDWKEVSSYILTNDPGSVIKRKA